MDATKPNLLPVTPTPNLEVGYESYAEFDPANVVDDEVLSFEDGDESVVEYSLRQSIYLEDSDNDDGRNKEESWSWNCTGGGDKKLKWVQEKKPAMVFGEQKKKKKNKKEEDSLDDGREEDRAFWELCLTSGYP